jgi:hypothetical protein
MTAAESIGTVTAPGDPDSSTSATATAAHAARTAAAISARVRRERLDAAVGVVHRPRREVDRGAEELAAALQHLAGIEADPHADRLLAHRQLALDRQGA